MKAQSLILLFLSLCMSSVTIAQTIHPDIQNKIWTAYWVAAPQTVPQAYGVYHFRKSFELPQTPSDFTIHVSADNRYKLYVNGTIISQGPARGDLSYWNFETLNIAPYLKKGKNTIAAIVWNEGDFRAEGQISHRTAFVLTGNTSAEKIVDTNPTWKSFSNQAYQPLSKGVGHPAYYVAGAGELLDYSKTLPTNWNSESFDDTNGQMLNELAGEVLVPKEFQI
jgi:hypothetical protein